jgi:hypothetical protein
MKMTEDRYPWVTEWHQQRAKDILAKDDFAKLTKDGPTRFTKNDITSLKLAIEYAKGDRKEQIESMLVDNSWIEVAQFASYHCQMESLRLDSTDSPPCWIDDPDNPHPEGPWHWGEREAAQLLKKMMSLGISKYHPDPIKAVPSGMRLEFGLANSPGT